MDLFVFVPVVKPFTEPKISYIVFWEQFSHFQRHISVQVKLIPNYYIAIFVFVNLLTTGTKTKRSTFFETPCSKTAQQQQYHTMDQISTVSSYVRYKTLTTILTTVDISKVQFILLLLKDLFTFLLMSIPDPQLLYPHQFTLHPIMLLTFQCDLLAISHALHS